MKTKLEPVIFKDDGMFYVEQNQLDLAIHENGFLLRRCAVTLTSPGGYECIGNFRRTLYGKWTASIDAPDNHPELEFVELGIFGDRDDAINALWTRRHEAHCRHP